MTSIVHVEVSGLTGSGKSAVMGEIEIALKALGLKVEHGPDFQAEKNGTHADWQQALDLNQPTVVLTERNISRQPQAREEAQPVAWRFRDHPNNGWVYTGLGGRHDGCEVEPLYTAPPAPEAEKLRVAVEAEQLGTALAELVSWFTKPVQGERGLVWVIPAGQQGADDAVAQALAALQQEGRDRG